MIRGKKKKKNYHHCYYIIYENGRNERIFFSFLRNKSNDNLEWKKRANRIELHCYRPMRAMIITIGRILAELQSSSLSYTVPASLSFCVRCPRKVAGTTYLVLGRTTSRYETFLVFCFRFNVYNIQKVVNHRDFFPSPLRMLTLSSVHSLRKRCK